MKPVKRLAQGLRLIALFLCILAANLVSTRPEAAPVQEDQVKAAILYKLSRFIQWPRKTRTDTLTVCMLGKDPLNDYVSSLKGRKNMSQTIDVRILTAFDDKASLCNLLFVNESAQKQLEHVLNSLRSTSVLTVSDIKDFAKQGGMVELVRESNRVSFTLNLPATKAGGFVISSQLMKIARVIR
ncbi:YfiR family protein [Kistimonas asteriae]|uniref:YfiR family protein n=1 Tax=Kistimonas asteriae TaxID=517724 RepID=UPI001BA61DB0|nr:YfiR family protein [Kistimonas asteriae]